MKEQIKEVMKRVAALQDVRSSVDKAARYLNAEFPACFYANKRDLWVQYSDNGKPEARKLATF